MALTLLTLTTGMGAGGQQQQSGIQERVERRLYQFDVSVRGPRERVQQLGVEDFELVVVGRQLEEFYVDPLCSEIGADEHEPGETAIAANERNAATPIYLFYFDQPHLTMEGRRVSLETSRELIPRIIRGGSEAEADHRP